MTETEAQRLHWIRGYQIQKLVPQGIMLKTT